MESKREREGGRKEMQEKRRARLRDREIKKAHSVYETEPYRMEASIVRLG